MSHVTERRGSPQTLVCRKTREGYRRQCRLHAEDVAAMHALRALGGGVVPAPESARLAAAAARQPKAAED
jgi:predicted alternative tryptophan synthase beta-subunit